ncbi:hypothetical protein D3C73_1644500 [compost metagenome]
MLVNGLDGDSLRCCDDPSIKWVTIKASALADLIMAVNDMRESGKALDADRQMDLIGSGE